MADFLTGSGNNTGSINSSSDQSSQNQQQSSGGGGAGSMLTTGAMVAGGGLAATGAAKAGIALNRIAKHSGFEKGISTMLDKKAVSEMPAAKFTSGMNNFGKTANRFMNSAGGKNIAKMGKWGLGLAAAGALGSLFTKNKDNSQQ